MAHFRNLGFLSKSVKLICITNNSCENYLFNNQQICRRHLQTITNLNKSLKSLYSSFLNPKFATLYEPVCQLHLSSLDNTTTESHPKKGLADELLAAKVSPNDKNEETSEDSSKAEQEERARTLRALKFSYYAFGTMMIGLGGFIIFSYGPPQKDAEGIVILDEFSQLPIVKQYISRTISEIKNFNKSIQEPTREKLLPDPLKEPYYQPPYTLVLEMKDILVHPEWTYETGWRFKKRPGVDFFLQHCKPPLFEIVIYTSEQGFTAYPVIEQLDPNGFIWYKLFKDSTRYVEGKHLKDLNCLNRDVNKVIVVDWDNNAITSLRNQLTLPRWKGNMNDQSLIELAIMLRTIAESEVSDVREVLDYYRPFDDPIAAFKENQRAAEEREFELQKARQGSQSKGFMSSFSSSFLRRH